MENRFYKDDDFEIFLKESTDNFSMYPSKKVWYSIYNDLHPSKKWPSLAVCLMLVSVILYVGVSNNNSINQSKLQANKPSYYKNFTQQNDFFAANLTQQIAGNNNVNNNVSANNVYKFTTDRNANTSTEITNQTASDLLNNALTSQENNPTISSSSIEASTPISSEEKWMIAGDKTASTLTSSTPHSGSITSNETLSDATLTKENDLATTTPDVNSELNKLSRTKLSFTISAEDKNWMENYAYNEKKASSKFKSLGSVQYHVAPSIGFRTLKKNNNFDVPAFAGQQGFVSPNSTNNLSINNEVTQQSAINMEAGITILYNVSKNVRLKTGAQLNYTSYISYADNLAHTTQTSLLLNDGKGGYTLAPHKSSYGNSISGAKDAKLNNRTLQISMPIGADIRLAGSNNLKWYAGGTIQPSYAVSGDVYAISADTRNYVHDNSLLRKFNMSAGLETFVSFKTPAGILISAGPQVRYQLLSTYNKQYSYNEKLYNFGIKFGITKPF